MEIISGREKKDFLRKIKPNKFRSKSIVFVLFRRVKCKFRDKKESKVHEDSLDLGTREKKN